MAKSPRTTPAGTAPPGEGLD